MCRRARSTLADSRCASRASNAIATTSPRPRPTRSIRCAPSGSVRCASRDQATAETRWRAGAAGRARAPRAPPWHDAGMIVHLVDGTYELFRHFYGARKYTKGKDARFGGVAGVLHTMLEMLEKDATHIGVATDHVIESFRNQLWPG